MASFTLLDAFVFWNALDLSGESNEVTVNLETDFKNSQTFGDTWEEGTPALKKGNIDVKGFLDTGMTSDLAAYLQILLGPTAEAITAGQDQTEGAPALLFQGRRQKYQLFGAHGDLAPVELSAPSTGKVTRGRLAKERGNVSATGAIGTGYQLGAVGATQYLYGSFHIFTAGTTITVVLESDDNSGFTTATTRATIGPLTSTGGTFITPVAGAISDTYFRYRVTAITGTFNVAAAFGVGS